MARPSKFQNRASVTVHMEEADKARLRVAADFAGMEIGDLARVVLLDYLSRENILQGALGADAELVQMGQNAVELLRKIAMETNSFFVSEAETL